MKKLVFPILLFLMASVLWAMPPMPGSGLTHDGSIREAEEFPSSFLASDSPSTSDSEVPLRAAKYPVSVSTTGNKKILVIRVDFFDLPFNYETLGADSHDAAYYEDLLENGSGLTMKKYYYDQSRTKLNLSFHVTDTYHASPYHGYAYYGSNDAAGDDLYERVAELVSDLLTEAAGDPSIPSGLDGSTVIVVHSGPGEEAGFNNPPLYAAAKNCIWSHRDKLSKRGFSPITVHGTKFDSYLVVPEYNYYRGIFEATIGVFCHEFGHVLGLPDAYDSSYATTGVGQWSLMGGGSWGSVGKAGAIPGSDPAPFMAWERLALGWIGENDITPATGSAEKYDFSNINDETAVYTVKLDEEQYLLLEGKAKNMSGTGMCVQESGLLITQIHKGILKEYWSANRINNGSYRPHGAMVLEAVAANYKANGLGNLWRSGTTESNRFTTTALFRSDTLTMVGPAVVSNSDAFTFLPLFIGTMIGSGAVISILLLWYYGRKKLCFALACAACAAFFSMSCVIESGGGGGTYDRGPNTNYYTSMSNVHTKTGLSGITIYNIKSSGDGSGSFTIKKE